MPSSANTENQIGWIHFMRIVACFVVVFAHCCDPFVAQVTTNYQAFVTGGAISSLTRPCVPLFVMITGVLLLPTGMNMTDFYKKRLKRILIPLAVWSLITPFLFYIYFNLGATTSNPNIIAHEHTLNATITKLWTFLFNFHYDTVPLWYLYMLVGLYLFMPIIGSWLQQARKKDIRCFLWIWGISLVVPYIQMVVPSLGYTGNYGDMGILGVCTWNPFGTFYYFSGFLGYLVLAYYLKTYPPAWSWKKTLSIAIPLFAIGYAITFGGFIEIQRAFPDDYAKLEVFWFFSSINVFMMTFACFIVLQKLPIRQTPFLSKLAGLTFGIYLCHFFFVQCGYDLVSKFASGLPYYLQIPSIAVIGFSASLLLSWLLSLNKWTRNNIM